VTTVEYGLSVLQGIFTENALDIAEGGNHSTPVGQMANFDHQHKFQTISWIGRGDK
jgi:hypothetical protein